MEGKRFIVWEFDKDDDDKYAGKFGVLHNDVCGQGMEAALMIDAFTLEADADAVCAALNEAYDKVIVGKEVFDPNVEEEEEEVE